MVFSYDGNKWQNLLTMDGLGTREGSLFSVHNRRLYLLLEEEKEKQGGAFLLTFVKLCVKTTFDPSSFYAMVI